MDPGDETQYNSTNDGRDACQVEGYVIGAQAITQQTWEHKEVTPDE